METHAKLEMYRDRIAEAKRRLDVIEAFLAGQVSAVYLPTTVESVYLQFRKVLELIVMASISANDGATDVIAEERLRDWHAGDILKAIRKVNCSYYYPTPSRLHEGRSSLLPDAGGSYRGEIVDFDGDFLTEDRFQTLYDRASEVIHTPNPFGRRPKAPDYASLWSQADAWHRRIANLLSHHHFKLPGDKDSMYVCYLGSDGEFHLATFVRIADVNDVPEELRAVGRTDSANLGDDGNR